MGALGRCGVVENLLSLFIQTQVLDKDGPYLIAMIVVL